MSETGNLEVETIKKMYDNVTNFSNGLAVAIKERKFFHIRSSDGKPIYEETFDGAGLFCEGLARVKLNGESFHICLNGKPAYQERYHEVYDFNQGLSVVWDSKNAFHIYCNGKPVYKKRFHDIGIIGQDGSISMTEKDGQEIKVYFWELSTM